MKLSKLYNNIFKEKLSIKPEKTTLLQDASKNFLGFFYGLATFGQRSRALSRTSCRTSNSDSSKYNRLADEAAPAHQGGSSSSDEADATQSPQPSITRALSSARAIKR